MAPNGDASSPSKPDTSSEIFDPFGLGYTSFHAMENYLEDTKKPAADDEGSSTRSPKPPPPLTRLAAVKKDSPPRITRISSPLPPRIVVKLGIHEEVSSMAKSGLEHDDGTSDVSVEGTVYAQVQSSDAMKNIPFRLSATTSDGHTLPFQGNRDFISSPASPPATPSASHLVQINKSEVTSVDVGKYSVTEEVQYMPLLIERKVSVSGSVCRVAVQVRSKLTNAGDLEDFTIAVAVPERVNANTVRVVHGDGVWDPLKRTIKWKVTRLPKGQSFMIAAQAELWAPVSAAEKKTVRFPVLLRCSSSSDQVSSVKFYASEAEGHPAAISVSTFHSFRLLHRLT